MLSKIISYLKKYTFGLSVMLLDIFFFSTVSPAVTSSFMIVGGCILLGLSMYIVWALTSKLLIWLGALPRQHRRAFVIAGTLLSVGMLLMQSIGQLSIRDIAAALPLAAILYLYITRLSRSSLVNGR